MPTAFSQRLLTIAGGALFLVLLLSYYSTVSNDYGHQLTWEYHVLQLLMLSGTLLITVFLEVVNQKRTDLAKTLALILIVSQGAIILYRFYTLGNIFEESFGDAKYVIYQLVFQLSYLLLPTGIMLTGISYFNTGKLFGYSNRTLLLLYSASSLIGRFFFLLLYGAALMNHQNLFNNATVYDQLYYLIDPFFDIAVLIFIFSDFTPLTQTPEPERHSDLLDVESTVLPEEKTTTMSVLWWMGKYLLLMIPLVNIVFLLIWSGKRQPRLLRNWAAGQYTVTSLGIIASIFLVYNSNSTDSLTNIGMLLFPVVLIVIGIILLSRADQPESVSDDSPGIGAWVGRIFLAGIPIIGWIFLIINATDPSDKTRQNWAKCQLLMIAVYLIFYVNYLSTIDRINSMLSYTEFAF